MLGWVAARGQDVTHLRLHGAAMLLRLGSDPGFDRCIKPAHDDGCHADRLSRGDVVTAITRPVEAAPKGAHPSISPKRSGPTVRARGSGPPW